MSRGKKQANVDTVLISRWMYTGVLWSQAGCISSSIFTVRRRRRRWRPQRIRLGRKQRYSHHWIIRLHSQVLELRNWKVPQYLQRPWRPNNMYGYGSTWKGKSRKMKKILLFSNISSHFKVIVNTTRCGQIVLEGTDFVSHILLKCAYDKCTLLLAVSSTTLCLLVKFFIETFLTCFRFFSPDLQIKR